MNKLNQNKEATERKEKLTKDTVVILASKSEARKQILKYYKIHFKTAPHTIDEGKQKKKNKSLSPRKIALKLAQAKAESVAKKYPKNIVIGSDQLLVFQEKIFNKAKSIDEGIKNLEMFSGREHNLISATYIVKNNKHIWSTTTKATVKLRKLNKKEILDYSKKNPKTLLETVGGYKIEDDKLKCIKLIAGTREDVMGFPIKEFINKKIEKKKIYVVGNPIKHSLSPDIHNYWIKENDLIAHYEKLLVQENEIKELKKILMQGDVLGANITVPYKEKIIKIADKIDKETKESKASNTIYKSGESICATNTDGKGFITSIKRDFNLELENSNVFLIGAGGAAKGIAISLCNAKVGKITILNRNQQRAKRLGFMCKNFKTKINLQNWENKKIPKATDLVVNCTSIGMKANEKLELDFSVVKKGIFIYDIVYKKGKTFLLRRSTKLGHRTSDGLSMLIRQAAESFHYWFNIYPTEKQIESAKKIVKKKT